MYAVVGVAAPLLMLAAASFVTVDEGDRAVVTTWGEATGEMNPGVNFKLPIMQGAEIYTVREQVAACGGLEMFKDIDNVNPGHAANATAK